jgi:hypothetical protein
MRRENLAMKCVRQALFASPRPSAEIAGWVAVIGFDSRSRLEGAAGAGNVSDSANAKGFADKKSDLLGSPPEKEKVAR